MTDTVRLLWVYNIHKCAEMHEAMTDVTGLVQKPSEQHVELGTTRCNRDIEVLTESSIGLLTMIPLMFRGTN